MRVSRHQDGQPALTDVLPDFARPDASTSGKGSLAAARVCIRYAGAQVGSFASHDDHGMAAPDPAGKPCGLLNENWVACRSGRECGAARKPVRQALLHRPALRQ